MFEKFVNTGQKSFISCVRPFLYQEIFFPFGIKQIRGKQGAESIFSGKIALLKSNRKLFAVCKPNNLFF